MGGDGGGVFGAGGAGCAWLLGFALGFLCVAQFLRGDVHAFAIDDAGGKQVVIDLAADGGKVFAPQLVAFGGFFCGEGAGFWRCALVR